MFLAYGLFKIRQFLKCSLFKDHINNQMMHAHLACFTIYLLGGIMLQVAINFMYLTNAQQAHVVTLYMMILCLFVDFGAAITQCFIFYRIG